MGMLSHVGDKQSLANHTSFLIRGMTVHVLVHSYCDRQNLQFALENEKKTSFSWGQFNAFVSQSFPPSSLLMTFPVNGFPLLLL